MTEKKEIEMNVYQKLAKARAMLQKKPLKKSGENKYAGFKYFELADFLPAVTEIFAEVGLCSQFYIDEEKMVDVSTNEEPYFVQRPAIAYLDIIDTDRPNQFIEFKSGIADAGTKGASPIQQLGSVHTYMRRYLWLEAMEITECDGVDALNQKEQIEPAKPKSTAKKPAKAEKPVETPPVQGITEEQIVQIVDLFNGDSERMAKMMNVYQVEALDQLNMKQAANIIRRLEAKK